MSNIACLGECMLELSNLPNGDYRMGFGGDTLNTAIYLARLGVEVGFVSAIGSESYSDNMLEAWVSENVGTSDVLIDPNKSVGLYAIQIDSAGERSFNYWRSDSAAKNMFSQSDVYFSSLNKYDAIYTTGITLSLMSDQTFKDFIQFLKGLKKLNKQIIFDLNYRPKNWQNAVQAKERVATFLQVTDIALPSYDDEEILFNDGSIENCLTRYIKAGVKEVVLKNGADGCYVYANNSTQHYPVSEMVNPKDTTAAGDSFNAGYLAMRMRKKDIGQAIACAQKTAALVIQHPGALVDQHVFKRAML